MPLSPVLVSYSPLFLFRTPRRLFHPRNQPEICQWNCAQLANALLAAELVGKEEAEEVLRGYAEVRGATLCFGWLRHIMSCRLDCCVLHALPHGLAMLARGRGESGRGVGNSCSDRVHFRVGLHLACAQMGLLVLTCHRPYPQPLPPPPPPPSCCSLSTSVACTVGPARPPAHPGPPPTDPRPCPCPCPPSPQVLLSEYNSRMAAKMGLSSYDKPLVRTGSCWLGLALAGGWTRICWWLLWRWWW